MVGTTVSGVTGTGNLIASSNVGTITLIDSTITGCTATSSSYPTLITAKLGTIKLNNNYIHHNTGVGEGTIFITLSAISGSGSRFERNVAGSRSHNIYISTIQSLATFTNFTFTDDPVYSSTDSVQATFISIADGDLALHGCTFTGAHNLFGAVYLNGEIQTITANNTVFQNGVIPTPTRFGQAASGIYALGIINLNYSTFTNNIQAIFAGNGDFFYSTGTVFNGNTYIAVYFDGVSYVNFASTTFNGHLDHTIWDYSSKSQITETMSAGIICMMCVNITIASSTFKNLAKFAASDITYFGAALQVDDSQSLSTMTTTINITGSTFYNNIADKGGSIHIKIPDPNIATISITDTTFQYNFAWDLGGSIWYHAYALTTSLFTLQGTTTFKDGYAAAGAGAVYYESHRPTSTLATTSFSNNTSPYGPNFGSYPTSLAIIKDPSYSLWKAKKEALGDDYRMLMADEEYQCDSHPLRNLAYETATTSPNFVSGLYMEPPLVIGMQDAEGQTCLIWNQGSGTVTFASSKVSPYTTTEFKTKDGLIVFYPMKLSFATGQSTTATVKTSISVDSGSSSQTTSLDITFTSNFRLCGRGERTTDTDECYRCPKPTYLLSKTASGTCNACPDNLQCFGGDTIGPDANYWRLDGWKTKALSCLNDEACLGYTVSNSTGLHCTEQLNDTFCYTGWCSKNYRGNLCATCSSGNAKSGEIFCVACSDNPGYYVLFVVILFVAIGFIVFTVKNAMKVKKDIKETPKSAVLMKIFTNYTQLISIVASFDFDWPDQVTGLFSAQSKVASSSSSVFSIDCFFPEATPGNSFRPFFVRLLFISLSPVLLVGIAALVWWLILKRWYKVRNLPFNQHEFKSKLTTTSVVLLFMVHTNIIQTTLQGFKCDNLGDGTETVYYLNQDLDIQCFTGLHNYWSLGCAMPAFIFWGLGIPLFAWRLLKKNIHRFDTLEFKSKFGFLYDGYRVKKYYWEFIILYRKIAMVFISIFLVTFGVHIQALCVLAVAFLSYILQTYSDPFMHDELNMMEKKALVSASLTLYAGIYFVTKALPVAAEWILVIIVFVLNAVFFLSWLKALVMDYKKQFKDGKAAAEKAKKDKEEMIAKLIAEGKPIPPEPPKPPTPIDKLKACLKKKKKKGQVDPEAGPDQGENTQLNPVPVPQSENNQSDQIVGAPAERHQGEIQGENQIELQPINNNPDIQLPNDDDPPAPKYNKRNIDDFPPKEKKQRKGLCYKQRKTSDF